MFSKLCQVVAAAVVTMVTQEAVEARGAAGFAAHTEDVIPPRSGPLWRPSFVFFGHI